MALLLVWDVRENWYVILNGIDSTITDLNTHREGFQPGCSHAITGVGNCLISGYLGIIPG